MTEPSQAQAGPELAYVWSPELERAASRLPSNIGRSHMVHSLIRALDIVTTVAPDPALGTRKQLLRYHTEGYISAAPRDFADRSCIWRG